MKRLLIAALAGAWAFVTPVIPAHAAVTVGAWEMNEAPGATVLVDSSGNGYNGTIGTGIQLNGSYFNWPFRSPTAPPADKQRLALIPHRDVLNPGTGNYSVWFRYRTTQHFGNIIQKGQGGATGGYFKIENPSGYIECKFRGRKPDGTWAAKVVKSPTVLSDGNWHNILCERTSTSLKLYVDGMLVSSRTGSTGNIVNTRPISIAGKLNCNNLPGGTTCDYFTGSVDYVRITK
jgi:hypothetical protein